MRNLFCLYFMLLGFFSNALHIVMLLIDSTITLTCVSPYFRPDSNSFELNVLNSWRRKIKRRLIHHLNLVLTY